eukprot:90213-Amphidinium_carterae.1
MGPMLRPMGMMGPPPMMASMPMPAMPVQQVQPGPKIEETRSTCTLSVDKKSPLQLHRYPHEEE